MRSNQEALDETNVAISNKIQEVINHDPTLAGDLINLIMAAEVLSHRIGTEEGFAVGRMTREEVEEALEEDR